MSDSKTVTIDSPTKKAIVVGVAALCLCVVGALLVVGRGSGGTSFPDAAGRTSGPAQQQGAGPTRNGGGLGQDDGESGGLRGGASLDELRQCLRDQGVTLPDPTQRGRGQGLELSDTMRQAFEACRQYLPDRTSRGGFGGPGPGDGSGAPAMPPSGQNGQSGGGGSSDDSTF